MQSKAERLDMRTLVRTAIATTAAIFIALPAFAATTVKVTEGGEGGQPMTLTLDQSSVRAGETIFKVHNDAMTEDHEMVLVKLKSPRRKNPRRYDEASRRREKAQKPW